MIFSSIFLFFLFFSTVKEAALKVEKDYSEESVGALKLQGVTERVDMPEMIFDKYYESQLVYVPGLNVANN